MKVINFGSLNIDHVYNVDHIVAPGETIAAKNIQIMPGGKGLNQSIALARAGTETYHAGCVGSDGDWLAQMLLDAGVKTDYLKKVEEVNGHAIIQVNKNGQNCIIIYGGSNIVLTKEHVDAILEQVKEDAVVLVQNEISHVPYIAQRCKEKGIPLAFNPSPFTPELLETFPFDAVTYLLINETEGFQITGCDDPRKIVDMLLSKYPKMKIVLTLGGNGALYKDADEEYLVPTFPVKVVDTTGAGDTFTGFFLGRILKGERTDAALRYANAAASIGVTQMGAASSIPTLEAVEEFLLQFERENRDGSI